MVAGDRVGTAAATAHWKLQPSQIFLERPAPLGLRDSFDVATVPCKTGILHCLVTMYSTK